MVPVRLWYSPYSQLRGSGGSGSRAGGGWPTVCTCIWMSSSCLALCSPNSWVFLFCLVDLQYSNFEYGIDSIGISPQTICHPRVCKSVSVGKWGRSCSGRISPFLCWSNDTELIPVFRGDVTGRIWSKNTIFGYAAREYRRNRTAGINAFIKTTRIGSVKRKYFSARPGGCTSVGPPKIGDTIFRLEVIVDSVFTSKDVAVITSSASRKVGIKQKLS